MDNTLITSQPATAQNEIQNILSDVTSPVTQERSAPHHNKRLLVWVVTVGLLILTGVLIYMAIFDKGTADKGLSREEKLYILNELQAQPVAELTRNEQVEAFEALDAASSGRTLGVDPVLDRQIMDLYGPQGIAE